MPETHTNTPIFYEALADAAKCTPAEAIDHFRLTETDQERGTMHAVESFLEDYAAAGK